MRWLIDGYNVIRLDPDLRGAEARGLEPGRAALLRLVAVAARRCADDFTVVFDGAHVPGPESAPGQVEVLFSRPPQTADDVLIRLAGQWRDGAIVVSSDRRVQDAARRAGCPVLAVDAFLSALDSPAGQGDAAEEDEDPDAEEWTPRAKKGNPHRLSRDARAAQRALRRLRGR